MKCLTLNRTWPWRMFARASTRWRQQYRQYKFWKNPWMTIMIHDTQCNLLHLKLIFYHNNICIGQIKCAAQMISILVSILCSLLPITQFSLPSCSSDRSSSHIQNALMEPKHFIRVKLLYQNTDNISLPTRKLCHSLHNDLKTLTTSGITICIIIAFVRGTNWG